MNTSEILTHAQPLNLPGDWRVGRNPDSTLPVCVSTTSRTSTNRFRLARRVLQKLSGLPGI